MNPKSTSQAAEELGITRKTLVVWLYRHPECKPTAKIEPSGDFLWTDQDIEKVRESRKQKSKGGRPKKESK